MSGRDTARDLEDAPVYSDEKKTNKGMVSVVSPDDSILNPAYAKKLGKDIWNSSTNWLNQGKRLKWNDSLRAFQGLHPSSSKYLSNDFKYRSRLYRPKTRAMVRNAEASSAEAFFANEDIVHISAVDDDDPRQQASAEIIKNLIQYRLTSTIPWFQTLVGARQDAEVMGVCIGKAYWKYAEKHQETVQRPKIDPVSGMPMLTSEGVLDMEDYDVFLKTQDHPWIDLIAAENFRFDPAADWRNPVATSPYTIEMHPMYIADVMAKMDAGDWIKVSSSAVRGAIDLDDDATRRSREQGRVPGKDNDAWKPREFDICWVRENIVRHKGDDWHFFSLASSGELLTNPRPIQEVYLHGIRPYVVGNVVLEAHKVYPTSKVELAKDLQTNINDVTNLRLDNVKLALNPRQFVAAGQGIDPSDLRSFNPAKVVILGGKMMPGDAIKWDRPPDVTAGSYQEQDRLNMDWDEILGGTSNSTIQAMPQVYRTTDNMEMMDGNASKLEEYDQKVFAHTFAEPIIKHLVKLEQAYETDATILAIAGQKAQLFQKFGIDQITDDLLKQELTVKVNVGLGATKPEKRLNNLTKAAGVVGQIFGPAAAQGANFEEIVKEVFSACGYKDGARFFMPGFDVHAAQQALAAGGKQGPHPHEVEQAKNDMALEQAKTQHDMQIAQMQLQQKEREMQMDAQNEEKKIHLMAWLEQQKQAAQAEQNRQQAQNDIMINREKSQNELQVKREIEMTKIALQAHSEKNQVAMKEMDSKGIKPDQMMEPFTKTLQQLIASQGAPKHIQLDNGRTAEVTADPYFLETKHRQLKDDVNSDIGKAMSPINEAMQSHGKMIEELIGNHSKSQENSKVQNQLLQKLVNSTSDGQMALANAIQQLAKAHSAPRKKKAIRDSKGKLIGVEEHV